LFGNRPEDRTMNVLQRIANKHLLKNAAAYGSGASVLSAVVLALCSKRDQNSFAGGLNGPSQWLWGEREAYTRRATLRHTLLGYLIHHATSTFWAALYAAVFRNARAKSVPRVLAEAAGTTAAAYVVDYKLTPKRLRPGFEKHIGPKSMVAVYAAFALGLAAVTLLRRDRR
jgi:hypothetical protein